MGGAPPSGLTLFGTAIAVRHGPPPSREAEAVQAIAVSRVGDPGGLERALLTTPSDGRTLASPTPGTLLAETHRRGAGCGANLPGIFLA